MQNRREAQLRVMVEAPGVFQPGSGYSKPMIRSRYAIIALCSADHRDGTQFAWVCVRSVNVKLQHAGIFRGEQ